MTHRLVCCAAASVLALTLVPAAMAAESADSTGLCHPSSSAPISRVEPGPYDYGKRDVVDLESKFDGESIHMGYVLPKVPAGTRVPVVVFASPYLDHNLRNDDLTNCEPRLMQNFVSHGYAIGLVAVRGTSDSGGCSDLMGPAERADLDQAITWFGTRPWSNGRVGMVGVSYDGSTPWEVAAEGNKYLKTIVPISGVNDLYHLMYRNGAPEFRGPLVLNALYYLYGFQEDNIAEGRSAQHTISGIVCPEAFEGFAASLESTSSGERDSLGFWAERNSRPGVEKKYRGSIFLVHGLQDWNVDPAHDFPWVTSLEKRGIYVKYLLGQWNHAWPDSNRTVSSPPVLSVRWDWADLLLDWWDYWLKGDRSVALGPRAQVQDSEGAWRNESSWPPRDAQATKLFLGTDSSLTSRSSKDTGSEMLMLDPARMATSAGPGTACAGCATFETGTFKEEFRFAGIPELNATVTPTGPSGHVSAWLYSAPKEGTARRVGWGMVDLRFAQGGEEAREVTAGEPIELSLPIEPLDVVVPAGSRLVLVVSQGSYGQSVLASGDHLPSSPPFPVELETGGAGNFLMLHIFDRGRDAFFKPPIAPRPPS